MIEQMEEALEFGKGLIDTELDAGLFNFIIKPVVKTFYKYWSDHDARQGTLQQIKVTLDCARKLCNGEVEMSFDDAVEGHFQTYLEADQTFRQCKPKHKNFKKLKDLTKEEFIIRVTEAILFLKVTEEAHSYDDLVRIVFKTKEKAKESLIRQLDFNEKGIKIVEDDPTILKIPTGKNIILKALRNGFNNTRDELIRRLDNIF